MSYRVNMYIPVYISEKLKKFKTVRYLLNYTYIYTYIVYTN